MGLFNFGGAAADAQPWLRRKDWASGRVKNSSGLSGILFIGVFALFWNAISWTLTVKILTEGIREPITYVVLLFPSVGLGLLGWLAYMILRWRKYGKVVFEMSEVPGVLGGVLGGVVMIPTKVAPREGFRVSLKNLHIYTTGSGKNRRRTESVLWESTQLLRQEAMADDPTRTALPIYFEIPYDTNATSGHRTFSVEVTGPGMRSRGTYSWKLEVKAETEGIDFRASFAVPVYRTEHSDVNQTQSALNDPSRDRNSSPTQSYQAEVDPERELSEAGIQISGEPGAGKRYAFRRKKSLGIILLLVVIGGAVPLGLIAAAGAGQLEWVFGLVGIVMGLVGSGIGILYMGNATLTVYRDRVDLENRSLFGTQRRTVPAERLVRIELNEWLQSNGVPIYSLEFYEDGSAEKPFKLRSGLKGMPLANQAVKAIYAALGRTGTDAGG